MSVYILLRGAVRARENGDELRGAKAQHVDELLLKFGRFALLNTKVRKVRSFRNLINAAFLEPGKSAMRNPILLPLPLFTRSLFQVVCTFDVLISFSWIWRTGKVPSPWSGKSSISILSLLNPFLNMVSISSVPAR